MFIRSCIPLYFLVGARSFRGRPAHDADGAGPGDLPPPTPVARVLCELGAPPARRASLRAPRERERRTRADGAHRGLAPVDRSDDVHPGRRCHGRSVVDALVDARRRCPRARGARRGRLDEEQTTAARLLAAQEARCGRSCRSFTRRSGSEQPPCHRKLALFDGSTSSPRDEPRRGVHGPTPLPEDARRAGVVSGPSRGRAAIFESDWAFCEEGTRRRGDRSADAGEAGDATVQLVPSGPDMVTTRCTTR